MDAETGKPIPNQTLEEEDSKGKEARILHRKLFEEQRQKFKPYQGCWKNNTCPDIFVTEMQVSGDTATLSKLKVSPKFERVNIRSEIRRQVAPSNQLLESPKSFLKMPISSLKLQLSKSLVALSGKTILPQLYAQYYEYDYRYARNTNANTWAPTNGSINTGFYGRDQNNIESRYIYNEFYWAGAGRLTEFGERSAYEHDFFLNNSQTSALGTGTYLTEDQVWTGYPEVWYAESNLPESYLDTAITDESIYYGFC